MTIDIPLFSSLGGEYHAFRWGGHRTFVKVSRGEEQDAFDVCCGIASFLRKENGLSLAESSRSSPAFTFYLAGLSLSESDALFILVGESQNSVPRSLRLEEYVVFADASRSLHDMALHLTTLTAERELSVRVAEFLRYRQSKDPFDRVAGTNGFWYGLFEIVDSGSDEVVREMYISKAHQDPAPLINSHNELRLYLGKDSALYPSPEELEEVLDDRFEKQAEEALSDDDCEELDDDDIDDLFDIQE